MNFQTAITFYLLTIRNLNFVQCFFVFGQTFSINWRFKYWFKASLIAKVKKTKKIKRIFLTNMYLFLTYLFTFNSDMALFFIFVAYLLRYIPLKYNNRVFKTALSSTKRWIRYQIFDHKWSFYIKDSCQVFGWIK